MSSIQPLVIDRDIRHLGPNDELSSASLLPVSRALAQRDSTVVDKLNEVVGAVNNLSRFVTLPAVPVQVAGGASIQLCNFRVPAGFEVRVINTAVSSSKTDGAEAAVKYQAGVFGGDGTGLNSSTLVETTSEVSIAGEWVGAGEIVLVLRNQSAESAAIKSSVLLELRPQA